MGYVIEVLQPESSPYRVDVSAPLEVGREVDGLVVSDPRASKRHLQLFPGPDGLTVTDLGSLNGTFVNGVRIGGQMNVRAGDRILVGQTELVVMEPAPAHANEAPTVRPASAPPPIYQPRPALEELQSRSNDAAVLRFRPGTPGEAAAGSMLAAARRARRRLAGLGSEPWGVLPQICLVDPFPDPAHPGGVLTEGTIVDAEHGEIWMVVTAESPPEPPERPLALFFGASLPAASDIAMLLEGFGLHLAETPDPDRDLRELKLPPLPGAPDELRGPMALSFVRWLIKRSGAPDFLRLLASSQPGRVDAAAREVYGDAMGVLEDSWRTSLRARPPDVKTGQFLRVALRYLRPHVRREIETFVYMLLGLGFTLVFPFIFRRLLDTAIPSRQFHQVLVLLGVLAVAFAVSLVAGVRRAYLSAYVSGSVVRQIRMDMYEKLQTLSAGWFGQHEAGDVLSRFFSDVGALEAGLSQTLREGLFQLLSMVVSAGVLLTLNPLLGVITLAGAPLIAVVYRGMAKGAQARSMAVQEQTGTVLSIASENYSAQPVVKAFGLAAREVARFRQASDRLFRKEVSLQLFGGLFGLSVNMIVMILRIVVLGLGAWLILQGHLTIGGLVAFVTLMGEVLSPVTVLTGIGQQIQASTGALVRINEVMGEVPTVADTPQATPLSPLQQEIRLADVSFSYTPERRTLEDVTVVIPCGSRVAFVGPTGAGKSSVLQLLMRFYDPDEGAVLFDGLDIRQATLASLHQQIGMVFQETFLFGTTVRENLAMAKPGATSQEIEAAAQAAEVHEFVSAMPRGYDTPVGEKGGRLSGGQRQRLAIARALLRDPRVLLLDEATSALDPRTERLIADTLHRVGQGRTTIAVTHRLTSITDYDRIFVIVAGRLVEQGTHDELVEEGGVYAELWAEQTGGRVPTEAPFDPAGALARIPIFAGLDLAALASVAGRLRAVEIAPGEAIPEGRGRLMVIRRGRARVLGPGLSGELVPSTELGPGDAFGLSALLGNETGGQLQALEKVTLLVLDRQALSGVAATFPTVAAALKGGAPPAVGPAGGLRLSRVILTSAIPSAPAPVPPPTAPGREEMRRLTGAFPVPR